MKRERKIIIPQKFTPDRTQAMDWWNAMDGEQRRTKVQLHFPTRHFSTMTGREIQIMWGKRDNLKKKYPL